MSEISFGRLPQRTDEVLAGKPGTGPKDHAVRKDRLRQTHAVAEADARADPFATTARSTHAAPVAEQRASVALPTAGAGTLRGAMSATNRIARSRGHGGFTRTFDRGIPGLRR